MVMFEEGKQPVMSTSEKEKFLNKGWDQISDKLTSLREADQKSTAGIGF